MWTQIDALEEHGVKTEAGIGVMHSNTGQGMPRIASHQQKLGQRHRTCSVLELLEGTILANILVLNL